MLAGAGAVGVPPAAISPRLALEGGLAVEQHLRARLLDRLIGGAGASLNRAAQATAVMDEADRVGCYAERYHRPHDSQPRSFRWCCSRWCFPGTGWSGYCSCYARRWPR